MTSIRVAAGKPLQKTEILGLFIFIFMAVVVLAVGTALFCDWLVERGSAPAGTPVELRPISGELAIAGAIRVASLVIGVQVVGALSLVVLYTLSGVRRGA